MNLFVCDSPRHVHNPYTGDDLSVPCGRCHSCLSKRSASWCERLEIERMCHPYSVFFTLTYSDDFVHHIYFNKEDKKYYHGDTGEMVLDPYGEGYVRNSATEFYMYNRPDILVADVSDAQNFIKRIRSKVSYYETDKQKSQVRYYIISEFGPQTLRPHLHGILFFESTWFAENFEKVIREAWSTDGRNKLRVPLGRIEAEHVKTTCSSYVADYVNGFMSLPYIYRAKAFRPLQLFSRSPAIGTLLVKTEEIQELFDTQSPKMSVYRRATGKVESIPLSRSLKNRLYPKFKGFDQISHFCRVGVFKTFTQYLQSDYERSFYGFSLFLDKWLVGFYKRHENNIKHYRKYLPIFDLIHDIFMDSHDSTLHRFYATMNRANHIMCQFAIDEEELVTRIERFDENVEKCKLKEYFEMQQEVSLTEPPDVLIHCDENYIRKLIAEGVSPRDRIILMSYNINPDDFANLDQAARECPEEIVDLMRYDHSLYRSGVSKSVERYNKSIKKRKEGDYVRSHALCKIVSTFNSLT